MVFAPGFNRNRHSADSKTKLKVQTKHRTDTVRTLRYAKPINRHGDRNVLDDQALSRSSGIRMLHTEFLRRLSHAVVRGSADAVLDVLRRNF